MPQVNAQCDADLARSRPPLGADAVGPEHAPGGRRIGCKQPGWPDRTPDELTAAVRADSAQDVLGAVAAPGALIAADERVRCGRVEVSVATFTIRPQLKHSRSIGGRSPRAQPVGRRSSAGTRFSPQARMRRAAGPGGSVRGAGSPWSRPGTSCSRGQPARTPA